MLRLIIRDERPSGLVFAWPAFSCDNWDCLRRFWIGRFWPGEKNGFYYCSTRCLVEYLPPESSHTRYKLEEFLEGLQRSQEASRKSRQMIIATQRAHLRTAKSKLRFPR